MWNKIRRLWGGSPEWKHPPEYEAIRADIETILRLDLATDAARGAHRDLVLGVLRRLDAAVEDIRVQANGYPANPISGLVWMNGAGYAGLANELTTHFRSAGWLDREEIASALWAKATLAVCSHYHHMVGPAMLANADCQERLGNAERAASLYSSVVLDFAFIADDWSEEPEAPTPDDRLALVSLLTATERLMSRGTKELEGIDLSSLAPRVAEMLARPVTD